MAKLSTYEAVCRLLDETRRRRSTLAGYRRCLKSCQFLQFTPEQTGHILRFLDMEHLAKADAKEGDKLN